MAHFRETALVAVTENFHAIISAKLSLVLMILDSSASFDIVEHKTLLTILKRLGVSGI